MIGWENNQGAYFVNKLAGEVKDTNDNIGDMSDLETTATSDLVSAINSIKSKMDFEYVDSATGKSDSVEVPAGWKELNILVLIDNSTYTSVVLHVVKTNLQANTTYILRFKAKNASADLSVEAYLRNLADTPCYRF